MSWNPTSYNLFCNEFFGYKLKGNGVYLGDFNLFTCGYFGYKCQIIVRVLAIANSHKEKSRLPSTKTWRIGI
jgi:hypothetical protein